MTATHEIDVVLRVQRGRRLVAATSIRLPFTGAFAGVLGQETSPWLRLDLTEGGTHLVEGSDELDQVVEALADGVVRATTRMLRKHDADLLDEPRAREHIRQQVLLDLVTAEQR
jgi:hypothetical protein